MRVKEGGREVEWGMEMWVGARGGGEGESEEVQLPVSQRARTEVVQMSVRSPHRTRTQRSETGRHCCCSGRYRDEPRTPSAESRIPSGTASECVRLGSTDAVDRDAPR